jgi:acylphosphatase
MKVCFIVDEHEIVIEKQLSLIQLIINGKVHAEEKNFFKVQNEDYDLKGVVKNEQGDEIEVIARFQHGFFVDEITLLYDGKVFDTKQIV